MGTVAFVLALAAFAGAALSFVVSLAIARRLGEIEERLELGVPDSMTRLENGRRLPSLVGEMDGGGRWDGSALVGPAVLSILSGSCTACVDSARELRALFDEDRSAGQLIVAYGEPAEETEHLDRILGDLPTTVRFDRAALHDQYAVGATPFHYAIDRNGEIARAALLPSQVFETIRGFSR